MDLLKPDYYDDFSCIADKCTISCCREWKINVDDVTYRKWKAVQPPEDVPGHRSSLQAYTIKKEGSRIMKMTEDHDCPFLAESQSLQTGKCIWETRYFLKPVRSFQGRSILLRGTKKQL